MIPKKGSYLHNKPSEKPHIFCTDIKNRRVEQHILTHEDVGEASSKEIESEDGEFCQ